MTASELRETLQEKLPAIETPPGDLGRVIHRGLRLRRRRRALIGGAGLACVLAVTLTVGLGLLGQDGTDNGRRFTSIGRLDLDPGLRAYGDPGGTLHLGGRTFDGSQLEFLDTDATGTPYGIVFFDSGRPYLLDESGSSRALVRGPVDAANGFHPTAKADSRRPYVAWATLRGSTATVTVRDMDTGRDVATRDVDCEDACGRLVIDAVDDGVVFLRTASGIATWDSATDAYTEFAGQDTRVADVRNGVVLYDGPAPTNPGDWRLVRGAVDAQLTFDGGHVLSWSSRLEPTVQGDDPILLDVGSAKGEDGLGFYNIDTDGSILLAYTTDYPRFTVYDCVVPSGKCTEIGRLRPEGGDPMFLGNDM